MKRIHQLLLLASTIAVAGCADGLDAPVARFAGSYNAATGSLDLTSLDGDTELEQAVLRKVEVETNDGNATSVDAGMVQVRNGTIFGETTAGDIGADPACAPDLSPVFSFTLRVRNNTGVALNPVVVRMDTVDGGADAFCHTDGLADVTDAIGGGLDRGLLASYNLGNAAQNGETGLAGGDRTIIALLTGVGADFSFTGSVFGNSP